MSAPATYTVHDPTPKTYDDSVVCGRPLLAGKHLKTAPPRCQSLVGCTECEQCAVHCDCGYAEDS